MRRWQRWLVLVALAAAACGGSDERVFQADFDLRGADMVYTGLEHHMTAAGVRRGTLWADTGYVYDDSARIHLRNPVVDLYDEMGRVAGHLTGREGELYTETELMVIRGDVLLTTEEMNRRITTSELNFDCQSDRLWSDSATVIIEEGRQVDASAGFTADCQVRNVRIQGFRGRGAAGQRIGL